MAAIALGCTAAGCSVFSIDSRSGRPVETGRILIVSGFATAQKP